MWVGWLKGEDCSRERERGKSVCQSESVPQNMTWKAGRVNGGAQEFIFAFFPPRRCFCLVVFSPLVQFAGG